MCKEAEIIPQIVEIYGLSIRTSLPLPGSPSARMVPDFDLLIAEPRPVPGCAAKGELLAHAEWHDGFGYAHVRTEGGYSLRILKVVEFELNAEMSTIRCTVSPDYDIDVALIFFLGNVLTFIMVMRGECVLHASAIAFEGQVTAFVGPSGAGKTTIAAMLCMDGASLVTDDVLRIALPRDGSAAVCYPGTGQLRLRETSAILAGDAGGQRKTADFRTLLAPQSVTRSLPLRRIVFPQPSRTHSKLLMTPVSPADAVLRMLAAPRICGLPFSQRIFTQLSELARRAETQSATIPWGPPFPKGLLSEITS